MLKNVHLAPQWLVQLEKKVHALTPHASFRLFLTTEINPKLPVTLLRNSRVFVYEPAAGVRSNMLRTLNSVSPEAMSAQPAERSRVYVLLAWFHAVVQERLRYAPLGWSKKYEFNDADLRSAFDTVDTWINTAAKGRSNLPPNKIPWAALRTLLSQSIYGGKIDNEIDQRLLDSFVNQVFTEKSFDHDFKFVEGEEGFSGPEGNTREQMMQWVAELPTKQSPLWLGLPSHAEKVLLASRAQLLAVNMLKLQRSEDDDEAPSKASSEQTSSLEIPPWMRALAVNAAQWLAALPNSIVELKRTPERIKDPLFRFFEREIKTGQSLLTLIRHDLDDVIAACNGQLKQTNHIRQLLSTLSRGIVFNGWLTAYKVPSGLTVNQWIADLALRIKQLQNLSEAIGANKDFHSLRVWMGGLFVPEAFITATRQAVAQAHSWPLEQLVLRLEARADGDNSAVDDCSFIVTGLRVEGAEIHGDSVKQSSVISFAVPLTVLKWTKGDDRNKALLVELPMYLNSARAMLIFTVNLQSSGGIAPQVYYQRGVCMVSSTLTGAAN